MIMSKARLAIGVLAAVVQLSAQASLLNPIEYDTGRLHWLALSETEGISIVQLAEGYGGWTNKYRFASPDEVTGLLASFGLTEPWLPLTENTAPFYRFITTVGGIDHQSGGPGTWNYGPAWGEGAAGHTLGMSVTVGTIGTDHSRSDCRDNIVCAYAYWDYGSVNIYTSDDMIGTFLVREDPRPAHVPEPSTLMLLGGGVLAGLSRRKRK
jgi:hypothetical protein